MSEPGPLIHWHTPYLPDGSDRVPTPDWPDGWPVPRVGDELVLPRAGVEPGTGDPLEVAHVIWYPAGEDDPEPFVYVVLRPK